jgi:hypothetical protein
MIDTINEFSGARLIEVFRRLLDFAELAAMHLTATEATPPMVAPLTAHPALVEARAVAEQIGVNRNTQEE